MGRSKAIVLHPQHQRHHADPSKRALDVAYRPANIRIRRAILAGKRGPTTPVPSWKLYENPSYDGIIAGVHPGEATGRQITISARKLAATLWELQELPLCRAPPSTKSSSTTRSYQHHHRESVGSPKHLMLPPPSPTTPVPQNCAKPTSTQHFTKSSDSNRRSPYSDSGAYHSRRASEEIYSSETPRHSFEMEQQQEQRADEAAAAVKSGQLEGVATSNDLLKVLSHIRGLDGQNPSAPLAAVLRVELEHTRQRVRELEHANKAARREIETFLDRVENERAAWRAKEQENVRAAVLAARQEAEEEKKMKRKVELVNRKLARDMDEVNMALSRAIKDLERERKARQLMEDVCDELAREIGQDKAEVEQLKRESEKVREEVEEERRMLQMAEVWREERVQMKLAEARHELEEKNAALDRLRSELEDFLRSKSTPGQQQSTFDVRKANMFRAAVDSLQRPPHSRARGGGDGSSGEDDLHSIDLNKESLYDRTQGNRWTYGRHAEAARLQQQQQQQQQEILPWKDKRSESRRKAFKSRARRLRKSRTYDESLIEKERATESDGGDSKKSENCELEDIQSGSDSGGRDEYAGAVSPSIGGGRIDTIPEQEELCMGSSRLSRQKIDGKCGVWHASSSPRDNDFALGIVQRRDSSRSQEGGCRTPTLSPMLRSSFPLSAVATPQRNSWSSGDLNPHVTRGMRGSIEWPRIGGSHHGHDNSLRTKLLEAKMEEPHARSKRDK